ncbi:unnamed protein product [Fraxinus pennsylvanica]|uniref:J domain-containing protein n=1 Tax=Fraxinus pennsylvanica TaxID=56036 RepID=A0AAD1ZYR9_9LAMI|nr:unnamed protein product [Fraxinus pennsylvanica]
MTTRSQNNIVKPKQLMDGTVRYPLPQSFLAITEATLFLFSFTPSIRSDPLPSSLSYRPEPTFRQLKSTYVDTISLSADRPVSFHDLLGISEKTGTQLEIKRAYKQLARKYHPDVSPPDRVQDYTERFIRVQEAYVTLSDPRMRALYDRDMAKGLHLAFSARGRT